MTSLRPLIAFVLATTASLAAAAGRPSTPSQDAAILIQLEVPGHFADGIHEIVTVKTVDGLAAVFKAKGSYAWPTGKLDYTEETVATGLTCEQPSPDSITCSRDDLPVDGARVTLHVVTAADGGPSVAVLTRTVRSWTTGRLETTRRTLIADARLVE